MPVKNAKIINFLFFMLKKISIPVIVFLLIIAGIYFVSKTTEKIPVNSAKTEVITTIFPLYDMAKNIGKNKVAVYSLLPPGIEAHSFEPKPSDVVKINRADIFIYTGNLIEPWAGDIIKGADGQQLLAVDTSRNIISHEHEDEHGGVDPHIWLDFDNAKVMALDITNAFTAKDPKNKTFYDKNYRDYTAVLSDLDRLYKNTLSTCKTRTIIYGGHYAFGYLTARYGLEYKAAQGFAPDAEPTASDLVQLVDQIRGEGIKYIFYEELTSPKISEMLAQETDAQILLLNAAHNLSKDQFAQGVSFFDILKTNLENLKIGLQCN